MVFIVYTLTQYTSMKENPVLLQFPLQKILVVNFLYSLESLQLYQTDLNSKIKYLLNFY